MVQSFGHFRQPLKLIFNSPAIFKWPEYLSTYSKFMSHFYTPWKYQETSYFFMFSRGIEIKCWLEMGCDFIIVSFMIFFIFQNISVLATEVIWCHRNLNSRNETWRWILGHWDKSSVELAIKLCIFDTIILLSYETKKVIYPLKSRNILFTWTNLEHKRKARW